MTATLDRFFGNYDMQAVIDWARVRSAATYVEGINRNKPAILIANSRHPMPAGA